MGKISLLTLMDRYNDDAKCRDTLEAIRWPNGVACLRCGDMDVGEVESRNQYCCRSCEYRFSVTAGTIMHDSHLPLRTWFIAIFLMCQAKKGMSARQLHRTLGLGSYKTAWYLCHRIREAMGNDPLSGPTLVGVVEVDETMVGGRKKGEDWRSNKHWVAGAIERGGRVRIERIPNVKRDTLHGFIRRTVRDEAEAIYTDDLKSYIGVGDDDTRHEDGQPFRRGMGHRRRPHQQHRRRVVPVQALHRRIFPQDERQAHGPLYRRTRMALQQPRQPQHLP